jgi:hypothetical protein
MRDRVDKQHGLVRTQAIQEILIGRDERLLLALVKVATDDFRLLIFQAQAMQQFDQTRAAFIFDPELSSDKGADHPRRARQSLDDPGLQLGFLRLAQK